VASENLEELIEKIHKAESDLKSAHYMDLGIIIKDGQTKIFQTLVFTLFGPGGEVHFGLRGQDITRYVDLHRSVELMNKKLSILGTATRHDVLNSLTGLFGYLELAECKSKEDQIKKYIQKAKISAETIKKQIEFTRDYQELGSKRPSWIDVGESIRSAYASISEPRIKIDADVSGLRVFADPMIEKVFFNLIDNVHRHSGANIIKVRFEDKGQEGVLLFEDDGKGIPAEEKDLIFTRGYGRNSGLGLYLVREVLDITGISIKENGEPGKGARFVITVPKGKYEVK